MTTPDTQDPLAVIFPSPRQASYMEGESELSMDVRLATNNVLPFIRKTIRSALSNAGIRVVANKKQFVVQINIVAPEELNKNDSLHADPDSYYEIIMVNNLVEIRTASQFGAIWGSQTFAAVYRAFGPGTRLSNLRIHDWSEKSERGLFLEASWGLERLAPDQWLPLMDCLIRNKLNVFGLNICGTIIDPGSGKLADMLLVPIPEHPELQTEIQSSWYDPQKRKWCQETILPRIFKENFLTNLTSSLREKGLQFLPGISPTALSRIIKKGEGLTTAPTLADPKLREILESYCKNLAEEYLPEQNRRLMLIFDNLTEDMDPKDFYGETPEGIENFIIWFLNNIAKGLFDSIIVEGKGGNNILNKLSPQFSSRLQELGLDSLLLPAASTKEEISGVSPENDQPGKIEEKWLITALYHDKVSAYQYQSRFSEIKKGCLEKGREKLPTMANWPFDPAYLDHIQFLAQLLWDPKTECELESLLDRGARVYGKWTDDYQSGIKNLIKASESQAVGQCLPPSAAGKSNKTNEEYPKDVLQSLAKNQTAREELEKSLEAADNAIADLEKIAGLKKEELDDFLIKSAASLLAEAARIKGLAAAVLVLLDNVKNLDGAKKTRQSALKSAYKELEASMRLIEQHKPHALVYAALAEFTPLLIFLGR